MCRFAKDLAWRGREAMTVRDAIEGKSYTILSVETGDEALNSFLFTLGCYGGESIRVVSHLRKNSIVMIKKGRYSIDLPLALAIAIEEKEDVK